MRLVSMGEEGRKTYATTSEKTALDSIAFFL
jgi:hypothetical protein